MKNYELFMQLSDKKFKK